MQWADLGINQPAVSPWSPSGQQSASWSSAPIAQRKSHWGEQGSGIPLAPLINEFKRLWGDIEIALDHAEGQTFVQALLASEPYCLDANFGQTLYRQTRGHPLFTVELLRGMQERGDLIRDAEGRWMQGPTLNWGILPARVEAVIAERIERLPGDLKQILRVASVEGEVFTAEVAAHGPNRR